LLLLWQEAFLSSTNAAEWASLTEQSYQPWRMYAFVSHEIAHQWWGGKSRIRGDRDQWFSEGFADYGCNIVMENYDIVNKTNWKQAQLNEWLGFLTKDDGYCNTLVPLALGNRIGSAENRRGYENYRQQFMYSKGSFIMQMLRTIARAKFGDGDKIKGDALFKQSVRDFMTACTGKAPSNYDLMTSFATSYGMKLDWFFKQWVFGMGIPKVEFSYQIVAAADGKGYMLRGRVKQRDTAFIFPVAVAFHQKGQKGDPPFYYQWITKGDETFEKGPIPFRPDKVTINDDKGLLAIVTPVDWETTAAGQ
jgi:aminopeptidase N